MADLILHHYATSPFSEKVRLILGAKQLPWKPVFIPPIMPKPDVEVLTGGYRKTPFLQIGADIYCDSALIADVLEHLQPAPTLYPEPEKGMSRILAQWADTTLFWAAMAWNLQPKGASEVFAKDLRFATLDTTQRTIRLPQGRPAIVADTVGFISDLPHELVESFRATLEEVGEADLILHVRDIASPDTEAQAKDVEAVLKQIPMVEGKPRRVLEVWNKIDLLDGDAREAVVGHAERLRGEGKAVAVSAWTGEGIDPLRDAIAALIDDDPETELVLDPSQGEALAWLYENGRVTGRETDGEGRTHVTVRLHPAALGRFQRQFG